MIVPPSPSALTPNKYHPSASHRSSFGASPPAPSKSTTMLTSSLSVSKEIVNGSSNPMEALRNQTSLVAVNKKLTSFKSILYLEHMVNLRSLNVHMNQIARLDRDIMALPCMRHLVELDLSGNDLESMQGLEYCTALATLNVSSNRISAVECLGSLYRLERLYLAFNLLEDLLGLRDLPGESLLFIDVSGNMLQRVDCVDALSHCANLRELRTAIPKMPSNAVKPESPHHRDAVPDAAVQLLDNPFVGKEGYSDAVRRLLPQLVLLDGQRVGFDPLESITSGKATFNLSNQSSPRHNTAPAVKLRDAQQCPVPLSTEALQRSRVDEYLNELQSIAGPQSSWLNECVGNSPALRTKRVSRSSQTAPIAAVSVSCGADTLGPGDAAQPPSPSASELLQLQTALVSEQSKTRGLDAAVRKLTQLLAVARGDNEECNRRLKEVVERNARECAALGHDCSHLRQQVEALKEELQRTASESAGKEGLQLRLLEDRLNAAAREREQHHRDKWQRKLSSVERDHQKHIEDLRRELEVQSRSMLQAAEESYRCILQSRDRTIHALQEEVQVLSTRHRDTESYAAQQVKLCVAARTDAIAHDESASRQHITCEAVNVLLDMHSVLQRHVHTYTHERLLQQLRNVSEALVASKAEALLRHVPASATPKRDAACGPSEKGEPTRHAVTQTECFDCDHCASLRRQVSELEAVALHQATVKRKDELTLRALQQDLEAAQQRCVAAADVHDEDVAALRRTLDNLRHSMAAQDEAHREELATMESEFHRKVDEKRHTIQQLEHQLQRATAAAEAAEEALRELEASRRAGEARNDEGQQMAAQNSRLLAAVQTLRHQLVAVDTANRSLAARNEALEATATVSQKREAQLTDQLHAAEAALASSEAERTKMKQSLRAIVAS